MLGSCSSWFRSAAGRPTPVISTLGPGIELAAGHQQRSMLGHNAIVSGNMTAAMHRRNCHLHCMLHVHGLGACGPSGSACNDGVSKLQGVTMQFCLRRGPRVDQAELMIVFMEWYGCIWCHGSCPLYFCFCPWVVSDGGYWLVCRPCWGW